MSDKAILASQWQKILRTDPKQLFGKYYSAIRKSNWDDWLAQPGYVGSSYAHGGLVFIGANPGGRKGREIGEADSRQHQLLLALRKATRRQRTSAFKELNGELGCSMKKWNIYATYIPEVLKGTGIQFSDVAFINLVKWRTVDQKMPRQLLEISWRAHTRDQLMMLRPSLMICLGETAGRFIHRMYGTTIPRTIRDGYVSPATRKAIRRARRQLREWKAKRAAR